MASGIACGRDISDKPLDELHLYELDMRNNMYRMWT